MLKNNYKNLINFISNDKILIIFIILISGLIYYFTVCPSIYIDDSSEFVTASLTLSIPHPSGYPLYTILGKIFSFIPILTPVWRINFMSAFFAINTLVIFYLILKELKINSLISFFTSILLGVSQTFWDLSTYAEVYTLNAFFVALCLWLIIRWSNKKTNKYLYLLSFFFGLSLTNHYSMLILIPGYAFLIIYKERSIVKKGKLIGKMFCLFLLGLSLYIYLPIRSAMNPPVDWFNPENASNFKKVLSYNLARGHAVNLDTLKYIGSFINNLLEQFYLFFVILGIIGLFACFKKNRPIFYFGIINLIFLSLGVIIVMVNGLKYSSFIAWFLSILYIPFYIYFAIFISMALNYFLKNKFLFIALMIVSVATTSYLFEKNYNINYKKDFYMLEDYSSSLISSLEPNAILLIKETGMQADNELFSLSFQKFVKNLRPDVTIYSDTPVFTAPKNIRLPKDYAKYDEREQQKIFFKTFLEKLNNARPIYATIPMENLELNLFSRSNGIAYKIYTNKEEAKRDTTESLSHCTKNLGLPGNNMNSREKGLLAKYLYTQSSCFMENNKKDISFKILKNAIYYDIEPMSLTYQDFVVHRNAYQ